MFNLTAYDFDLIRWEVKCVTETRLKLWSCPRPIPITFLSDFVNVIPHFSWNRIYFCFRLLRELSLPCLLLMYIPVTVWSIQCLRLETLSSIEGGSEGLEYCKGEMKGVSCCRRCCCQRRDGWHDWNKTKSLGRDVTGSSVTTSLVASVAQQ